MEHIAKKIRKEAKRAGVTVDDLANAVSSVQHGRKGQIYSAQEYDNMIVSDVPSLWEAAEKVADFIEQQNTTHTAK